MPIKKSENKLANPLKTAILISGLFGLLLWIVFAVEYFSGFSIHFLGILPRKIVGLPGIFTAPLIHGDLDHLYSNTIGIVPLIFLIILAFRPIAFRVFAWIWLTTGVWVWIAARTGTYHIGASGLIYGFAGFLIFSGLIRKDARVLAISMLVIFGYGSLVWGLLPVQPGVSWESHVLGALAGVVVAFFMRKKAIVPRRKYSWEIYPEAEEEEESAYWNYQKTIFLGNEVDENEKKAEL